MRFLAVAMAVLLGTAVASAQSDPKLQTAAAKPKPETTGKGPPKRAAAGARAKPKAQAAKDKSQAKTEVPDSDAPAYKGNAADKPTATGTAGTLSADAKSGLRVAYAAIPLAERAAIQSDLIWTGDYNGLIDGQLSDRLIDAVMSYQKRQKAKPTGVLSAGERAALSAAVRPTQEEAGWRVIDDPVTGARVGLPSKLATKTAPGSSGTRWSSAQGQLQIETFRIDTGATLDAVFEQQKKLAKRRVTYNVMRDNFFVVSGWQGLKKFYVRAFIKDNQVRGITISYDQAMEGTMDPMVVAMSSAFVPFAGYAAAIAADGPRRKVEYGTGLVVSRSGHIVTARAVTDGCQIITIPGLGHAERLVEDKDGELALVRVYGANGLTPVSLSGGPAEADSVTLLGIADPQMQAGGGAITTASAKLSGGALDPAPALGFSGAAALDKQGQLLGVAVQSAATVAGPASAPQATLVPLERLRNFLDTNYVPPSSGGSGFDDAKAGTVRVICVRK